MRCLNINDNLKKDVWWEREPEAGRGRLPRFTKLLKLHFYCILSLHHYKIMIDQK